MYNIIIIVICLFTILVLKFALNVNLKEIINLRKRKNIFLENVANKFETEEKICEEILRKLNNKEVKIEVDQNSSSSLYVVLTNKIILGKFNQSYMKIQTIAHECIHSIQNKFILWFNYIFSNIFNLYFIILSILSVFNIISNTNIQTIILIFAGLIQYIIRESLENEALIKAPIIAKEYINSKEIFTEKEKEELKSEYEYITKQGTSFMNFILISKNILRVIIYQIIIMV